jgi:hypothetical protein
MTHFPLSRTILVIAAISAAMVLSQSFSTKEGEPAPEKPKNLKVLPKKLTMEEVKNVMRTYTKALGVRCGHCHALQKADQTKYDFASDENKMKNTARGMMKMTNKINKKYLRKIGRGGFEQITCVTCHMGRTKPIISTDSIPSKMK